MYIMKGTEKRFKLNREAAMWHRELRKINFFKHKKISEKNEATKLEGRVKKITFLWFPLITFFSMLKVWRIQILGPQIQIW